MSTTDPDRFAAHDPATDPAVLADIAYRRPDLRPAIAAHPGAYPALLEWLAQLADPAIDAALAIRAQEEAPAPPVHAPAETQPLASPAPTEPHPAEPHPAEPRVAAPDNSPTDPPPPTDVHPATDAPSPTGPRRRRGPVIASVAAVAVALGGIGVFALPALLSDDAQPASGDAGGSPTTRASTDADTDADTDAAPAAGATILAGFTPTESDDLSQGAEVMWRFVLSEAHPELAGGILAQTEVPMGGASFDADLDGAGSWLVAEQSLALVQVGATWVAPYFDGAGRRGLLGLDPRSGEYRWHTTIEDLRSCAGTVSDGRLVCLGAGRLVFVDGSDGTLDELPVDRGTRGAILDASGDRILLWALGAGAASSVTALLDLSGTVLWQVEHPFLGAAFSSSVGVVAAQVTSDEVLFGNGTFAQVISLDDGSLLADVTGAAVLGADRHLLVDDTGYPDELLEIADVSFEHMTISTINAPGEVPGSYLRLDQSGVPAAYALYGADGLFYAIDVIDGGERWWASHYPMEPSEDVYVFGDCCHRAGIDTSTGALRWQTEAVSTTIRSAIVGEVLVVADREGGTLQGHALATGERLWTTQADGDGAGFVNSPPGTLVADQGSGGGLVRYGPVAGGAVAALTADLPECPGGMEAVSWSAWPGGWVIVCAPPGGGTGVFQASDAQLGQWTSEAITVTHDWSVQCAIAPDGGELCVRAEPALAELSTTGGGETSSVVVEASWFLGRGPGGAGVGATPPAHLPVCPAGTVPLSWGTWEGGWVLFCGTDARTPTHAFAEGIIDAASEDVDVASSGGGYCADVDGGQRLCAYASPATVELIGGDGTGTDGAGGDGAGGGRLQYSLDSSWTVGVGAGGAGQGQGAYGVDNPEATAADQVRYLSEILDRSAAARSDLITAVESLLACEGTSFVGEILAIEAVTQNRRDLLAALDAAPVDRIDNGGDVISQLSESLGHSLQADIAFGEWARAVDSGGCGAGDQHRQDGVDSSGEAQRAKAVFVETWNTTIAPAYGVPTVSAAEI